MINSCLLDLTTDTLGKNPEMRCIAPYVEDLGGSRWAITDDHQACAAPVTTQVLLEHLRPCGFDSFTDTMRNQLGGHAMKTE